MLHTVAPVLPSKPLSIITLLDAVAARALRIERFDRHVSIAFSLFLLSRWCADDWLAVRS